MWSKSGIRQTKHLFCRGFSIFWLTGGYKHAKKGLFLWFLAAKHKNWCQYFSKRIYDYSLNKRVFSIDEKAYSY